MIFKNKKSRKTRNLNKKSIKRNKKNRRTRKSNKNKRLKKYGGSEPYITVTFFGERMYQPDMKYNIDTTIGELISSKNGHLYHRGILLSSYPNQNALVRMVLPSDDPNTYKYNLNFVRKSNEPPPERIENKPVTPYEYQEDPNDIFDD